MIFSFSRPQASISFWTSILIIGLFTSNNSFAAFFPGETLDPNCAPSDPDCYIDIAQVRQANPYRFYDLDDSDYVEIQAPIDVPTSYLLVLPEDPGSAGQFLTTDGNGMLSWGTGNGILPDQTGHTGKYLQTDGTNTQWVPAMTTQYLDGAEIQFYNDGDTFYTGFVAPVGLLANTIYTLPTNYPNSNQVLQSDDSGNLSWVNASSGGGMGVFVGQTTNNYTGSLSSGGDTGYKAANALCDNDFPGSRLCTQTELIHSIAQLDISAIADWTNAAWIASGGAKYSPAVVPANDCNGFTHGVPGDYLGSFWMFDQTDGGAGGLGHCGNTIPLACCQ